MKLSTFLLASSFLLGFFAVGAKSASPSASKQRMLVNRVTSRSLAALKSSEVALEKCSAAYLRETVEKFYDELGDELSHLLVPTDAGAAESEALAQQLAALLDQSKEFQFTDASDMSRFDEEYVEQQIRESEGVIVDLQQLTKAADPAVKAAAKRSYDLFSKYLASLQHFERHFLAVDEHRIRDIAHQIWESEGRPEGQAVRHWAMAVELSKKLTTSELKAAFEQNQSVADLLASTRYDRDSIQGTIH